MLVQEDGTAARTRMITVITQMRPGGALALRLSFLATRCFPSLMGIAPLRSLYATRWSVLTRLPYNGPPQVRERAEHPYLVWESVYSAEMEPYVESFVAGIHQQINVTWFSSYGFPGTGSVTRLRRYVEQMSWPEGCSYSAYPDQSARMVLSALAVAKEHPFLVRAARDSTPAQFGVLYRGFLRRRQGDL